MSNQNIVLDIIAYMGTKENLKSIQNCYTRVRMTVKDVSKCDLDALKKLEDVLGVVVEGNGVQLVVGPGKSAKLANELSDRTGIKSEEVDEAELLKQANKSDRSHVVL